MVSYRFLEETERIHTPGRQCTNNATLMHVRSKIVAVEKAIINTYSECVSVALVSRHAMPMRHIVICGLPGFTTFFTHYLTNVTSFEKKMSQNLKCLYRISLQLLSETFLIPRRLERDMVISVLRSSRTVPGILVRF